MTNDIIFTSTPDCSKCKGLLMGVSDYSSTQSPCYCCELLGKQLIGVAPKIVVEREQTQTKHELIIKLYSEGSSKKDIATKTGLAASTVKNIIGGTTAIRDKKAKRDKEILKMAEKGISSLDIAKKFSVSVATVKGVRCKK
jgi:DNA-binding NarL/FixJ family response regulator